MPLSTNWNYSGVSALMSMVDSLRRRPSQTRKTAIGLPMVEQSLADDITQPPIRFETKEHRYDITNETTKPIEYLYSESALTR